MTKRIPTSYIAFIAVAAMFTMTGIVVAHASEVTGTLSSDISSDSQTDGDIGGDVSSDSNTDGNISGTVSDDSDTSGNISGTVSSDSDGSSGGGSSSGGGTSVSLSEEPEEPVGAVLGETTDTPSAPNFPNAGALPSSSATTPTLWSALITFFKNVIAS